MRLLSIVFFVQISWISKSQELRSGVYKNNYFGENIELRHDSTFYYTWNGHMQGSWTKGQWSIKGDTIFFYMIPVYDTVLIKKVDGSLIDSLRLSLDSLPSREELKTDVLYAGGQNYRPHPDKLFFKKGRLHGINADRSLRKRKVKGFGTNKKVPTWYQKRIV